MAAPIGHIISALALLNGTTTTLDQNAFIAGTSFPDIRYITDISRSATHRLEKHSLMTVLDTSSSFEAGRRFHVFVDREREKFMREHDAYRFIKNGSLKTQLLKLVEDHILFDQYKNRLDTKAIFDKIYPEELNYGLSLSSIEAWHNILKQYLDDTHWFNITRYYNALKEFKEVYAKSRELFSSFWTGVRTVGFLLYAYVQVVHLSNNQDLREIVLEFYEKKMPELIKKEFDKQEDSTVERHSLGPPLACL